ncbi:MAG TPA: thioredoxin domain-containing protein [Acidimicrobiia bacterium]|nr:thioredoxin domain-containing protein [Acidimicrobiia bacterium]
MLGGVLAAAALVGFFYSRSSSSTANAKVVKPASAVGPNGGVLVGDPNAPVTITEFGDFQCPVCRELQQMWEPTLQQLIQQGKVKFEFVGLQFLDQGTTESLRSAAAGVCAADANKFLDYYTALYDGQSRGENSGFLTNAQLEKFGRSAGIDDAAFDRCVSSGRYIGWVGKNTDATTRRDIVSTPTVLLNGKAISNAVAADPQGLADAVNQAAGRS